MSNDTSNANQFRILILEDDPISQASVSQAVLRAVPESVLLAARNIADGRRLLDKYDFQLAVLDIQLPDGSGLDFLHDIQLKAPRACIVILTGVPLPQHRDQAEAFGVLHFMEKPAHFRTLGNLVRKEWEMCLGIKPAQPTGFTAALTQLTTLDIIQLKCLGRATVNLDFIGNHGEHGRIVFKDGEVFHAETEDQKGVEAFYEIVSWRGGQVLEVTDAPEPSRTVEGNWQRLLMEAVHWVDEHKSP